jgi:hypothetical protein
LAFRTALYIPSDGFVGGQRSRMGPDDAIPPLTQSQRDEAYLRLMEVQESRPEVVYKSQYTYLVIAVCLTLIATFCVITILEGWCHLGRNVSLSPIEIARRLMRRC